MCGQAQASSGAGENQSSMEVSPSKDGLLLCQSGDNTGVVSMGKQQDLIHGVH